MDLARIVVIGPSCAGKTTLARHLAERLGSPLVRVDPLRWRAGWQRVPIEELRQTLDLALSGSSWVCDGNDRRVSDVTIGRATAVIWLNYTYGTVLRHAIQRSVRRLITRQRFGTGDRQTFRGTFFSRRSPLLYGCQDYQRRQRACEALFADAAVPLQSRLQFRSTREAAGFLDTLSGRS